MGEENQQQELSGLIEDRDWLYKSGEDICGPLHDGDMTALIMNGVLTAETMVSVNHGDWTRLDSVPGFKPHLAKAAVLLKKKREEEARLAAEKAEERKRWAVAGAIGAAATALIVTAGVAVWKFKAWELIAGVPPERVELRGATMDEWVDRHPPLVSLGMRKLLNTEEKKAAEKREQQAEQKKKQQKRVAQADKPQAVDFSNKEKGEVATASALTDKDIYGVIQKNIPKLYVCLRDELKRTPDLRGQLDMEFSIRNDGMVGDVMIDDQRFRHGPMRDCFAEKLAQWRFPPYQGESRVIKYPFFIGKK